MRSVLRVKRFILYIADEAVLGEADWCIMWITRVVPDAKTMLSLPHLPERSPCAPSAQPYYMHAEQNAHAHYMRCTTVTLYLLFALQFSLYVKG